MVNKDNPFEDDWLASLKNLTKSRQDYVDKITSPLIVKVNVYIDGNNLFINLEKDLEHILEIYKTAQDNYRFYLSTLDDFEAMQQEQFNPISDLDKSSEKLANLAAWYLNSMQSKIVDSIRIDNAKSLLGELDLNKNEIVFPAEVAFKKNFVDGLTYITLLEFILSKKFPSIINNEEEVMKVLTKIINSIEEFKNIKIPLKAEIFRNFLKENTNIKNKLLEKLKTFNLENLKNKVFIKFKFNYSIYRAEKIDVNEHIEIFKKKLRIRNLNDAQKNFYSENIELLKKKKIRLHIKSPKVFDISYRDDYYEKLESMTKGESKYGFFKFNSFSFGEKAVDTRLIMDCQESMTNGNADIHCVLSNDTDFYPLFEKAKEIKKELYLCSVVPRKTIAKNLRDIVDAKNIFHIKYVDLEAMFHKVLGTDWMGGDFVSFIKNKDKRKELIDETKKKINDLNNSLVAIEHNHKKMDIEIDKFLKERIE